MPKSKIPERWEIYSKMGKVIRGTTIMPIKVPLKESLTNYLPPEERFSPATLLHLLQSNSLKLGGVVDLTFTTRYYDSQFFFQNGIDYKKVYTAGQVVPDDRTYNQFSKAIKEIEKDGEVICVHCTHGLNRSGYLICRYLIEALNIKPKKAIKLFEEARGHKMERQNYLDDLMSRTPGVSYAHDHVQEPSGSERPGQWRNCQSNQDFRGNRSNGSAWGNERGRGYHHQNKRQRGQDRSFGACWNRDGLDSSSHGWSHGQDRKDEYSHNDYYPNPAVDRSGWYGARSDQMGQRIVWHDDGTTHYSGGVNNWQGERDVGYRGRQRDQYGRRNWHENDHQQYSSHSNQGYNGKSGSDRRRYGSGKKSGWNPSDMDIGKNDSR